MPFFRSRCRALVVLPCLACLTAMSDEPPAPAPSATTTATATSATAVDARREAVLLLIGRDVLAVFRDGQPWDAERESLVSVATTLSEFDAAALERNAVRLPDDVKIEEARGTLFELEGRLKSIAAVPLTDDELSAIYDKQLYDSDLNEIVLPPDDDPRRTAYRCGIEATLENGSTRAATVFALQVPDALRNKPRLDERIGLRGVLVKTAGTKPGEDPLLVTRRIAWYPPGLLGDAGFDFGLYDRLPLEAPKLDEFRECHAQLLSAVKKIDPAELQKQSAETSAVVPLFNEPEQMRGKLVTLEGALYRALLVRYDADDIRERFGIDHYYQVEIFPPDSKGNPVIFHLAELPADFPQGEDLNEHVRITGTFLVGYYYSRKQTTDEARKGKDPPHQKAPLLIGKTLTVIHRDDSIGWVEVGISSTIGLLVLGLIFVGWRSLRNSGRARVLMEEKNAPAAGTSLNDLQGDFRSGPDFSGLEQADRDAPGK